MTYLYVAAVAALASALFRTAVAVADRRVVPHTTVDEHAATAMALLTPDDDDGPPAGCLYEDCEDLADEAGTRPAPKVPPPLTRRQVARRFAAIAGAHPELRDLDRHVRSLYLIPDLSTEES